MTSVPLSPRPLSQFIHVPDMRYNNRYFGPDSDDDCPCGSRRRARSCHRARDQSWVAQPPRPLVTGPRTGYANPDCYGNVSADCSRDTTREHWLSAETLRHIAADGSVVRVGNAAWLGERPYADVGVNSLSSRILCGRHNGALSHLDTVASAFFQAFRDEQAEMMLHRETDTEFRCAFAVLNGPTLQLWLLKVLWGALVSGLATVDGRIANRFRLGVDSAQLAEILWRGAAWPITWAFYMFPRSFEGPVRMNSAGLRFINVGPEIVGGTVKLSGFDFCLAFERPHVPFIRQPGAIILQRKGFRHWKMFAFCWPDEGHQPIHAGCKVPPGADVYERPECRPGGGVIDLSQLRHTRSTLD